MLKLFGQFSLSLSPLLAGKFVFLEPLAGLCWFAVDDANGGFDEVVLGFSRSDRFEPAWPLVANQDGGWADATSLALDGSRCNPGLRGALYQLVVRVCLFLLAVVAVAKK